MYINSTIFVEKIYTMKKLSEFERHKTNPFLDKYSTYVEYAAKVIYIPDEAIDPDTGEIKKGYDNESRKFVKDTREYMRTFNSFYKLMGTLNVEALKVLSYIYKNIRIGEDDLYIDYNEAKELLGYKDVKSIYKGVEELLNKEIISREDSSRSMFFINPIFFFKGDPERKLKDHLIKTDQWDTITHRTHSGPVKPTNK